MKTLLRFENHKLFRQKSLYICLGIIIGLQVLAGVVVKAIMNSVNEEIGIGEGTLFLTPGSVMNGSSMMKSAPSSGYLVTLIIIVVSLFVCLDYSTGSMKNVLGRGFSRTKVYFGKYLAVLLAAGVMLGTFMLVSFVVGTAVGGVGDGFSGRYWLELLLESACLICRVTLVYMVVTALGRSGASIAICIAAPMVLELGLSLIDMIPKMPFELSPYWIGNVQSELKNGIPSGKDLVRVLLTMLAYFGGSLALGCWAANRKEV